MSHPEEQYLNLIRDILENGHLHEGRNGNTLSLFGNSMRFSLKDGTLPLLTTKKVAWKTCFKELIWFIQGKTDNTTLQEQNVKIWNGNSTREFLDSRGLVNNEVNDLGPVYGHQWRHFNAEYKDCHTDYTGKGVDQLQYIIDNLKSEEGRKSRRLIMSAWNPLQLDEMALPPCHVLAQFNVRSDGDKHYLSCALYQRSCDVGLGVPFNIASYSFLTHLIARHCDMIPEDFVYFMGNTHIYCDHVDALKQQITRDPLPFPKITITAQKNLEEYTIDDIEWDSKYNSHDTIKMAMSA
jgi:thymidylate synthase